MSTKCYFCSNTNVVRHSSFIAYCDKHLAYDRVLEDNFDKTNLSFKWLTDLKSKDYYLKIKALEAKHYELLVKIVKHSIITVLDSGANEECTVNIDFIPEKDLGEIQMILNYHKWIYETRYIEFDRKYVLSAVIKVGDLK